MKQKLIRVGWLIGAMLLVAAGRAEEPTETKPGWVDLLKAVKPSQHAVRGEWSQSDDGLAVNALAGARIALPWQPPAEYDFDVTFTRRSGTNSIALIFVAGGRQATLDLDGWGQNLAGIQNINGKTIRDNPTRVPNFELVNGRRYTATLRVRKKSVQVLIDGKLLTTYNGDGSNLSLLDLWRMPQKGTLGLGSWNSAATFHTVRVRPISVESASQPALTGTKPTPPPNTASQRPISSPNSEISDLAALSDEFDSADSLKSWKRVFQVERTGADQLQSIDIGRTVPGWLVMVPHTSTWYQDYRGVLVYKEVEGDFIVTTRVRVARRRGDGPPRSSFSLAGIMVRVPRQVTPQTWQPGGENYVFLSLGAAKNAGQFALEVKTTVDSRSRLEIRDAPGPEALIQVARIGQTLLLLRKEPNGAWLVHQRYRRPDMPKRLQVGMTVYTDYASASRLRPAEHNRQVIRGGNPDLVAGFDYFRFQRPQVPRGLQEKNLSEASAVSDAQLLGFLGESAVKQR